MDKVYKFQDQDGDVIQFTGPSDATQDEINDVLDQMYEKKQKKAPQPKVEEPKSSGAKGYLASAGDLAAGIAKIPAQTAIAIAGKVGSVIQGKDYNLDELWKQAGNVIDEHVPTFGKAAGVENTPEYNNIVQRGMGKVSEAIDKVGDVAGDVTGSKDVAGAVKIGANFLPIPGAKAVSKGLRKLKKKTTSGSPKLDALDSIDANKPEVPKPQEPTVVSVDSKGRASVNPDDAFWKQRAEQMQKEARAKELPQSKDTIVVDSQGEAGNPADFAWKERAAKQADQIRFQKAEQTDLPLASSPEQIAEMRSMREGQGDLFNNGANDLRPTPRPEVPMEPVREGPTGELPFGPIEHDTSTFRADQFGGHDGMGRFDENGIPIRADLSMEAANLENPLQRNLWGDELGPALGQEHSLTDAIDTMRETGRNAHGQLIGKETLSDTLGREIPASTELTDAIAAANKASSRYIPKNQRGGVNVTALKEVVSNIENRLKKLRNSAMYARMSFVEKMQNELPLVNELSEANKNLGDFYEQQRTANFNSELDSFKSLSDTLGEFKANENRAKLHLVKSLSEATQSANLGRETKLPTFTKGRGKKQSGAINVTEIADGFKKLADKIFPKLDMTPRTLANQESLLGKTLGKKFDSSIPVDESVDAVLAAAKGDKNPSLMAKSFTAGGTMGAMRSGSSAVLGVSRWWQNAAKRTEYLIREHVLPAEKEVYSLNKVEMTELADVFRREVVEGKQYSVQDLQRAGFTEKQILAHMKTRAMFERNFEALNQGRKAAGLEPISRREAYVSSRWGGPWRSAVVDKTGKLVWYIAERDRASAFKAVEWMKQNFPDLRIETPKSFEGTDIRRTPVMDAYSSALDILDRTDPVVAAIKERLEEHASTLAFNSLGHPKHFKRNTGIRGFLGDKPWIDEHANARDLFDSQFQYARNSMKWAESQPAMAKTKKILSDEFLNAEQADILKYIQNYTDHQLGRSELKFISEFEGYLANKLGTSRAQVSGAVGDVKGLWVTTKLFANAGYTVTNLLQSIVSTPAFHADLSANGIKHSVLTTLAKSMTDTSGAIMSHAMHRIGVLDRGVAGMTDIGKAALEYMENNGVIEKSLHDEAGIRAESKLGKVATKVTSNVITAPDKFARISAFMSYVHHLDQSGMYGKDWNKLFQKAEELQNASMVDPRATETAYGYAKLGSTGKMAQTLQNFQVNYLNQIAYFAHEALKGNVTPLGVFLTMNLLASGLTGLPFLNEADQLIRKLKELNIISEKIPSPKRVMLELDVPESLKNGIPSAATGLDIGSRFSPNSIADGAQIPFFNDASKIAGSAFEVAKGADQTLAGGGNEHLRRSAQQLGYQLGGPSVQGLMETGLPDFQISQNPDGSTNYYAPNKLVDRKFGVTRTPDQVEKRRYGFGLRDLKEAETRDLSYQTYLDEKRISDKLKVAPRDFYVAVRDGDTVRMKKIISNYVSNGGDPNKLFNSIEKYAYEENLAPEVITALKAQTLETATKISRIQKVLGKKLNAGE